MVLRYLTADRNLPYCRCIHLNIADDYCHRILYLFNESGATQMLWFSLTQDRKIKKIEKRTNNVPTIFTSKMDWKGLIASHKIIYILFRWCFPDSGDRRLKIRQQIYYCYSLWHVDPLCTTISEATYNSIINCYLFVWGRK